MEQTMDNRTMIDYWIKKNEENGLLKSMRKGGDGEEWKANEKDKTDKW